MECTLECTNLSCEMNTRLCAGEIVRYNFGVLNYDTNILADNSIPTFNVDVIQHGKGKEGQREKEEGWQENQRQ